MTKPLVSVIIPTYNRPERLAKVCLPALKAQTHRELEVVLVDDGSEPPLHHDLLREFAPGTIRLVRKGNGGPASARNCGVEVARGEILAFTDDDCAPEPTWVEKLVARLIDKPSAAVGGWTVNAVSGNAFSEASQQLVSYLYHYYRSRPYRGLFFTSNNFAAYASKVRAMGAFDLRYPLAAAEDRDFFDRWREAGLAMIAEPDAVVHHYHQLSWSRFWRQHHNYGRGAYHYRHARADRHSQPVEVEPVRFYWDLLTYPFTTKPTLEAARLSALLFISQVANIAGFFHEQRSSAQ
ncbi:MAG TPA: glycosyltransferase family 2 protein [Bryobacteraceae bacterium]|nr:glycosyltransferase family 2 protein [Bryobacteraceae bacterium]